jgi:hypothetical protein
LRLRTEDKKEEKEKDRIKTNKKRAERDNNNR